MCIRDRASSIARSMVTKFGMSDKLGAIAYGNESDEVFIGRTMAQARSYSEEVAGLIDEEVKAIVDQAYSCLLYTSSFTRLDSCSSLKRTS